MRQLALLAEQVDGSGRNAQVRSDLANRRQTVSKREAKTCQNLLTGGMDRSGLSSDGERLRVLAITSDGSIWPFKPRVLGSIPRRLIPSKLLPVLSRTSECR